MDKNKNKRISRSVGKDGYRREDLELRTNPRLRNCSKELSFTFIPPLYLLHSIFPPYFITLCLTLFFSELWALRTMFPFCFHTPSKDGGLDGGLDGAVRLSYMLYSFFWMIPRLLNFIFRRFGTLSSILIVGVSRNNSSFLHQL